MKHLLFILSAILLIASACGQERARVDLGTGDVLEYFTPRTAEPGVASQWVPVVRNAQPAYNSTTQYLTRTVTYAGGIVTVDWIIENKTQQQIDDEAAAAAASAVRTAKQQAVANAIATLRQWALDAEGTTVTNGNNTEVTQQVVDRLGVFFDRFADLVESQGITP